MLDDKIADMESNKQLNHIVTELEENSIFRLFSYQVLFQERISGTHKKFHYSSNRRKHQSLWLLVQDYKNNIDLLYDSHDLEIDQLLLSQSSLMFSQIIFLSMTILSYL